MNNEERSRKIQFKEIATLSINSFRTIVVSFTSEGNYCIAIRADIPDDNGRSSRVFLKNPIVLSPEKFSLFRDLLDSISSESIQEESSV